MAEEEKGDLQRIEADQFRAHHFGLNRRDAWLVRLLAVATMILGGVAIAVFVTQEQPALATFLRGRWFSGIGLAAVAVAAIHFLCRKLYRGESWFFFSTFVFIFGSLAMAVIVLAGLKASRLAAWQMSLPVLATAVPLWWLHSYFASIPEPTDHGLKKRRLAALFALVLAPVVAGYWIVRYFDFQTPPAVVVSAQPTPPPVHGEPSISDVATHPPIVIKPTATPASLSQEGNQLIDKLLEGLRKPFGTATPPVDPGPIKADPTIVAPANSGKSGSVWWHILIRFLVGWLSGLGPADTGTGGVREGVSTIISQLTTQAKEHGSIPADVLKQMDDLLKENGSKLNEQERALLQKFIDDHKGPPTIQ